MAITEQQRQNIEQANYVTGNGFTPDISKVDVLNRPMLVVGLGGTGIDAVLRVKAKVNEMFKAGKKENGQKKVAPDNVKFLCLDTDKEAFNKTYHGMTIAEDEGFNIGSASIGGFLGQMKTDQGKRNYPQIAEWLDPNLDFQDASGGAGGIRQISRTCLFQKADELYGKLRGLISTICGGNAENMIVFLLSGISGGTGSGTFIDMAYLIQQATLDVFGMLATPAMIWDKMTFLAYLFMPDVSMLNSNANYIKVNGYAALKELDYLMGIADRNEHFVQAYPGISSKIDSPNRPFGLVHLLSRYQLESGMMLAADTAYDQVMLTAAENITMFMANDATDKDSNLTPWGYQSNIATMIGNTISLLEESNMRKAVGYRYGLIGTSGRILPVSDIMACLASRLSDEIGVMMRNADPTNEQVLAIYGPGRMAIDEASIARELMAGMRVSLDMAREDPGLSVNSDTNPVIFNNFLQNIVNTININNSEKLIRSLCDRIEKHLVGCFTNTEPTLRPPLMPGQEPDRSIEFGPAFTQSLIVGADGSDHHNLLRLCRQEQQRIGDAIKSLTMFISQNEPIATLKLQEARDSVLQKKAHFKEYVDHMVKLYEAKVSLHRLNCEIAIYDRLIAYLAEQSQATFDTIKASLLALKECFDQNTKVIGDLSVRKKVQGATLSWNVVSYAEVEEYIKKLVAAHDMSAVANRLYAEIWENKKLWTSDQAQEYDVFGNITNFIGNEFSTMLNRSLEEYMLEKYKADSKGTQDFAEYIQSVFVPEMKREAELLFNGDKILMGTIPGLPERQLVQVPQDCAQIRAAIHQKAKNDPEISLGTTALRTRIMWNHTLHGVPLYTYSLIQQLDQTYTASFKAVGSGIGVHLRQTEKENWFNLPSIYPVDMYNDNYSNKEEIDRCNEAAALFDEAEKYGVIRFNPDASTHFLTETGVYDAQKAVEACGDNVNALKKMAAELRGYLDPAADLPMLTDVFGNQKYVRTDLYGSITREKAVMWFKASFEMIRRVRKEVEKYRGVEQALALIDEKLAALEGDKNAFEQYLQARIAGRIVREGLIYKCVPLRGDKIEIVRHPQLKNMDYYEYSLFQLIMKNRDKSILSDAMFKGLQKDIAAAFEESQNDYDAFVETITTLLDQANGFAEAYDMIQREYDVVEDGEDILKFYEDANRYLCSLIGRRMR